MEKNLAMSRRTLLKGAGAAAVVALLPRCGAQSTRYDDGSCQPGREVSSPVAVSWPMTGFLRLSAEPVAVWNGSEYGVFFRTSSSDVRPEGLYFSRLSAAGEVIRPATLLKEVGWYTPITAVWDGSNFAICWAESQADWTGTLFFSKVSAAGEMIGRETIIDTGGLADPALSFNGESFAVAYAWTMPPDGYVKQMRLQQLSFDGALQGNSLILDQDDHVLGTPAVAWGQESFAVAWSRGRAHGFDLFVNLVTENRILLPENLWLAEGGYRNINSSPKICSTSNGYEVVWWDGYHWEGRPEGTGSTFMARLSAAGELLNFPLSVHNEPGVVVMGPAVAWDGVSCNLAFTRVVHGFEYRSEIFVKRISLDLLEIGQAVQVSEPGIFADYPHIAAGPDGEGLIVWLEWADLAAPAQIKAAKVNCLP